MKVYVKFFILIKKDHATVKWVYSYLSCLYYKPKLVLDIAAHLLVPLTAAERKSNFYIAST